MKKVRLKIMALYFLGACFIISCSKAADKAESPATAGPSDLNSITTNLPDAPGYAGFKNNCTSCHSARYVQMQPNMPEKTWLAIVTKMQKSFGAPVADSSVNGIVEYLVAIKGKN